MDEWAGAHGQQRAAEEVCGARGQAADEVVKGVGRQVNWRGSPVKG